MTQRHSRLFHALATFLPIFAPTLLSVSSSVVHCPYRAVTGHRGSAHQHSASSALRAVTSFWVPSWVDPIPRCRHRHRVCVASGIHCQIQRRTRPCWLYSTSGCPRLLKPRSVATGWQGCGAVTAIWSESGLSRAASGAVSKGRSCCGAIANRVVTLSPRAVAQTSRRDVQDPPWLCRLPVSPARSHRYYAGECRSHGPRR